MRRFLLAFFFTATIILALAPVGVVAGTWRAEQDGTGDFIEIQPAVDASASGDTILIGPGNYNQARTIYVETWGDSTDVFVDVTRKDVTLIGSSKNEVFVGPDEYYSTLRGPIGFFSVGGFDLLRIENVAIRNCYTGVTGYGNLVLKNCVVDQLVGTGISLFGGGLSIQNCVFSDCERGIFATYCDYVHIQSSVFQQTISVFGFAPDVKIWNTSYENTLLDIRRSSGIIRDCIGVGSTIVVEDRGSVSIVGSDFTRPDGEALMVMDSAIASADSCVFRSGARVIELENGGLLTVQNSHILSSGLPSEMIVNCSYYLSGSAVIDLKNNYWGTTDVEEIAARIWDGNDDPALKVVVEFEPIATDEVPTEKTSHGSFKALFR